MKSCADESSSAMNVIIEEVKGWVSCFDEEELKDSLCGTSTTKIGDINTQTEILQKAFEIGKEI